MSSDTRVFQCPDCHKPFKLTYTNPVVKGMESWNGPLPADALPYKKQNSDELDNIASAADLKLQNFIEICKRNGIFAAFEQVVVHVKEGQTPKNMEKFLMIVLRTLRPVVVPRYLIDAFNAEFNGKTLQFFSAQELIVVTVSGKLAWFLPMATIRGQNIKHAFGHVSIGKMKTHDNGNEAIGMIRTKFGYVAGDGDGMMLENMRKRSIGEFARPVL